MHTPRFDFALALLAFALVILFARSAPGAPPAEVRMRAVVDRVEEEWLVLDLPPHPSLPIPHEMAEWARESDPLVLRVSRVKRSRGIVDPPESPWIAEVIGVAPLRLRSSTEFRWPAELAPKVRVGDHLAFLVEPAPAATIGGS